MNIHLTQEQYNKVLEADKAPIPYKAIREFKEKVNNISIEGIKIYELS